MSEPVDRSLAQSQTDVLTASPEAVLGAQLFRETRFSEYYAEHSYGNVNVALSSGESVMNEISASTGRALPDVHQGSGIDCRQCHLGDDFRDDDCALSILVLIK